MCMNSGHFAAGLVTVLHTSTMSTQLKADKMTKKRPADKRTTHSSPAKVSKGDLMCQVILEKLPPQIASTVEVRPVSLVWCGAEPVADTDIDVDMEMEVDEVKMEVFDEVEEDDVKTEAFDEDDTTAAAESDSESNMNNAPRWSTVTTSRRSKKLLAATGTVKQFTERAATCVSSCVRSVVTKTLSTNSQGVTIKSILEAKRHSADNVRSLLSTKYQPASSRSAPLAPVITVINLSSPASTTCHPTTTAQHLLSVPCIPPEAPVTVSRLTGVPTAVRSVLKQTVVTSPLQQPDHSQLILDANTPMSTSSKTTTTSTTSAVTSRSLTSSLTSNIDVSAIVLQSALPNSSSRAATTATDSNSLADIAARMISRQQQLVNSIANENSSSGINTVVLNRSKGALSAGATDHSYYVCEDAVELKRLLLESNARKHELVRKLKDQEKKSSFWCNKAKELQVLVTQLKQQLASSSSSTVS